MVDKISNMHDILTSFLTGISQSWDRLKANLDKTLSSHLICTQPGLLRNDHGWYHFSTICSQEHKVSSHRCSTCSLKTKSVNMYVYNLDMLSILLTAEIVAIQNFPKYINALKEKHLC